MRLLAPEFRFKWSLPIIHFVSRSNFYPYPLSPPSICPLSTTRLLLISCRGAETSCGAAVQTICHAANAVLNMGASDQPGMQRAEAADEMRLIARIRAGEQQAMSELYDRYSRVVYGGRVPGVAGCGGS